MGATMSLAQIHATGERVGAAMAREGLNTDLAPVADVDGRAVFPGQADPDLGEGGGQHGAAAAAKHQPECSKEFGQQFAWQSNANFRTVDIFRHKGLLFLDSDV